MNSATKTIDLRTIMVAHQERLLRELADASLFDHAPTMGDITEYDWCNFLSNFLPTRYQVSKAFVIDSLGNRSDQLDIVIHDRHFCPLFFEKDDARYVPAESVYAVFDVKQDFSRETILYSADKVASVRRLRRTSTTLVDRGETHQPREPFQILGGIVASRSDWRPALGEAFERSLVDANPAGRLDLGCTIEGGSFTARYGADLDLQRSEPDVALMFFTLQLFGLLQALGTVTAIDIHAYVNVLNEEGSYTP